MKELEDCVEQLNKIVLEIARDGKEVSFSPKFERPLGCGQLGSCPPIGFNLNVKVKQ